MLTIEIFHRGRWHEAATLTLPEPDKGLSGPAELEYNQAYALDWMQRDGLEACSLTLPVELIQVYRTSRWFGFLGDIMPSGASRRYWVNKLEIGHLPGYLQDYRLLEQGTIAPIGNLRIRQSLPDLPEGSGMQQQRFQVNDVVERDTDFLAYAQEMGAASGGATGAGGEAPKLLVRCSSSQQIWIDTFQDDLTTTDDHFLVKFPRGRRTDDDCNILRTEFHYYHELAALGVSTINPAKMRLLEGSRYPSLWLPRFDVSFAGGKIERYGLESVYAILNKDAGAFLNHFDVLRSLIQILSKQYQVVELAQPFDQAAFVIEWVKRDLLNVAFGNSDNHGRNTALLKTGKGISLAPVFDFAPMKLDPEGVVRTTKWGSPWEEGGVMNWQAISQELADLVEPELLLSELEDLAQKLIGLRERLAARGVPAQILDRPTLGLNHLNNKLKSWHLV